MSSKGAGSHRAYIMANNKATRESFEPRFEGSSEHQPNTVCGCVVCKAWRAEDPTNRRPGFLPMKERNE